MVKRIDPTFTTFSRSLRKNQTKAENLLWFHLKNKQLDGIKFRRQHKLDRYIVDFISIKEKGYTILRFWDNDVLQNVQTVLEMIHQAALHPHPDPLPKRERERE